METGYLFKKAMIIDDNELDNYISRKMIKDFHFAEMVFEHTSAKSALEFITNISKINVSKSDIYPDVIFVDLNMPEIDGFQFLELYRRFSAIHSFTSKIVILTSSVVQEDEYKANSIAPDAIFLRKPLSKEALSRIK